MLTLLTENIQSNAKIQRQKESKFFNYRKKTGRGNKSGRHADLADQTIGEKAKSSTVQNSLDQREPLTIVV